MREIFEKIERLNDPRQAGKVKHQIIDVVGIVLIGMLANADTWDEIQIFAVSHEGLLKQYLPLQAGIPSHDTLNRVMGLLSPEAMEDIQQTWNMLLQSDEGGKLKKLISIDGKTMRSSAVKENKPLHVVSAWSKADGLCFGQKMVAEKENEIIAIPALLKDIRIQGSIVTIDAMGTQKAIAEQIMRQKGDYVLPVKDNHPTLREDIALYFADEAFLEHAARLTMTEKARGQIEKRIYYQTEDISWLEGREDWRGIKSIGMVVHTITKGEVVTVQRRYYITSLPVHVTLSAKAVRGHWAIESMHWQLDVTFREDYNTTLDKNAALNLNILRKMCIPLLKALDIGMNASVKNKRFAFCSNPAKYIAQIFAF